MDGVYSCMLFLEAAATQMVKQKDEKGEMFPTDFMEISKGTLHFFNSLNVICPHKYITS